jgi:hypothetical protein
MKKLVLGLLLLVSLSAKAEWIEYGTSTKGDFIVYVDYASVRTKQDGTVLFQAYINAIDGEVDWLEKNVKYPYKSILVQYHLSCAKNDFSFHKAWAITYNEKDLKSVRKRLMTHGSILKTPPSSKHYPLIASVCSYR